METLGYTNSNKYNNEAIMIRKSILLTAAAMLLVGMTEARASDLQIYDSKTNKFLGNQKVLQYKTKLTQKAKLLGNKDSRDDFLGQIENAFKNTDKTRGPCLAVFAEPEVQARDKIEYEFESKACADVLLKIDQDLDQAVRGTTADGKLFRKSGGFYKPPAVSTHERQTANIKKPMGTRYPQGQGGLASTSPRGRTNNAGGPNDLLAESERVAPSNRGNKAE